MKSSLIQKFIIVIFAGVFLAQPFFVLAEENSNNADTDVINLTDQQAAESEQQLNKPLTFDNIDPKYYDYGYFAYQEEKIITEAISANDSMDEWQKMNLLSQLDNDDFYIMDTLNDKISYLQNNTNVLPGATVIASLYNFDSPVIAQNVYPKKSMNGLLQNAFAADTNYREQIKKMYIDAASAVSKSTGGSGGNINPQDYSAQLWNTILTKSSLLSILEHTNFLANFTGQYLYWESFFQSNPQWAQKQKILSYDLDLFYKYYPSSDKIKQSKNWTKYESEIISNWKKIVDDMDFKSNMRQTYTDMVVKNLADIYIAQASGEIIGYLTAKVGATIVASILRSMKLEMPNPTNLYNFFRNLSNQIAKKEAVPEFLIAFRTLIEKKILPFLKTASNIANIKIISLSDSQYQKIVSFLKLLDEGPRVVKIKTKSLDEVSINLQKMFRNSTASFTKADSITRYMVNTMDDLAKNKLFSPYLDKNLTRGFLENSVFIFDKVRMPKGCAGSYGGGIASLDYRYVFDANQETLIHEFFHFLNLRQFSINSMTLVNSASMPILGNFMGEVGSLQLREGFNQLATKIAIRQIKNPAFNTSVYVKEVKVADKVLELIQNKFGEKKGLKLFLDSYFNKNLDNLDSLTVGNFSTNLRAAIEKAGSDRNLATKNACEYINSLIK